MNLFDKYVTDATEDGLIDGLIRMTKDYQQGVVSEFQLEIEFPNGPQSVVDTFAERYPDVTINQSRIRQEFEKAIYPVPSQDEMSKILAELLGLEQDTVRGYITAPTCNNPNCQNPNCPNYKRRTISGKNKIGYIN